jgi:hypothetical protein
MTDTDHVLTHGYTVTAEFCGFSEPRAVVRQYGKWVSQHPTRSEAFDAIGERGGARPWLYRGDFKLHHQSQKLGRDLHAEKIVEYLGATAQAHHLSAEQIAADSLGYEFVIYSPESGAINWTAFRNADDFRAWMNAYGVTLDTDWEEIPDDFPVHELYDEDDATDRMSCGTCGREWDDAVPTGWTPTPSGRCPFEYFHERQWPMAGETFHILLPRHEEDMGPLDQRADD